ncbi:WYL domain-containing protein [Massilia sp. TW-1]|uniref:WYL domain-containing protein n=1 Tax=Telluria antibiotica TaxID=2717319 RepID=A0ABX0PJG9_9BURK|nr:WYL domain-containing protein [Telluria antibiotica]NIA57593.1 WYL domain-containing protein [Telluria antibiotica]
MRASRLLSIQMMLETRGPMSATELADALEISVRTLHRDIDQLTAAGVPIYAERGRTGGFRLLDGWNTRLTGLTPAEAQVVFLSGLAGPAADLGLDKPLQGARLKLLTSLPAASRAEAQKMQSRFHLDPVDWYREADAVPHLATVADAVWSERQLSMSYESWRDEVERVVHPLGLVLKAGAWYLVAASDGKPRTYRVSNIKRAAMLESRARRPARFDLARYWAESVARFESELYTDYADVLATPSGLKQLRYLNAAVARAVAEARPSRRKDGRVAVRVPIESVEHGAGQLLRLAPEVEVTGPGRLKRAIVSRLQHVSILYGC